MYRVDQTIVSTNTYPEIFEHFETFSHLSKCLYNAALFRIRQIFTGWDKTSRTDNEKEVFAEVALLEKTYPAIHVKRVISYSHLEKLMRVTKNPDFFAGLPMQTAQHILRQAVKDFDNWLVSLKEYKQDPSKYLGKPKMPHYKKTQKCSFTITNQDAVLYPLPMLDNTFIGMELKLPLTKHRLPMPHLPQDSVLKEVKVKPYYGRYLISLTFETSTVVSNPDMPETAAIDFGVNNIAAIVCTDRSSKIYKGGAVLAHNQLFAKKRATAVSIITKGHEKLFADSKFLRNLSFHHANFNLDQMHKISTDIVRYCIKHRVGMLVLGVNKNWKQRSNMGTVNNQNFVNMPTKLLRDLIIFKAQAADIVVIEQEESYTSKADITAMDLLPVYGVNDKEASFSGKRKKGFYHCANGLVINADCNGAANIMRKAIPNIWNNCDDFSFLATPEVSGFHELNPKCIPVKRIVAA